MTWMDGSAVTLAERVRSGQTTPSALVDAFITRIEEANPSLNALVADRFDAARQEAQAQTDSRPDDPPPLWGVPVTVKEFIEVEGMPNTGGLVARRGSVAQADSPLVTRLRQAGAIVLGVSNAPEVGLWTETVNRVYGRTNNPHDLTRTPGGSSGGEAALVACGASPLGFGTDIGGSVRLPAFCCGIFAHKPTRGVVPNVGLFPPMANETGRLHAAGPMARTVADLSLGLDVLAGPHPDDAACHGHMEPCTINNARDLEVLVVQNPGRPRVTASVRAAVNQAATALSERGARVTAWSHPALSRAFDLWAAAMEDASGDETFRSALGDGQPVHALREFGKLPFGRSNHILPALALLAIEGAMARLPKGRRQRLLQLTQDLDEALHERLGTNGVLLYPSYTRPAPRHKHMLLRPLDFACTALFNALGTPATQVPAGRTSQGLPTGLQVIGARGADRNTLAVAAWLESDLGGWVRPTPFA